MTAPSTPAHQLASGWWAAAIAAAPRSAFVPDLVWPFRFDRPATAVDRRTDPDGWLAAVEADTALIFQWDNGDHAGLEPGVVPTSSASQPTVVAAMLADARLEPGMTVLEIGTGTGWSAALTAAIVGPDRVVTIEVDPDVAAGARKALEASGSRVEATVGDGALGAPHAAPFDRVIATAGVRRIPAAWIQQTRPGGLIVAPWGTDFTPRDAVAVLTVQSDGTAAGRFTRPVEFMKLRADVPVRPDHGGYVTDGLDGARESVSALPVAGVVDRRWSGSAFAVGLLVPNVARAVDTRDPDAPTVWLYSLSDLSWAVGVQDGDESNVWQDGPRSLWDEVKAAYQWWVDVGQPGVERFGITADGSGEVAWLDEPGRMLPYFGG